MSKYSKPVEVLSFMNGNKPATIVTDGEVHKSFEFTQCKNHPTLRSAIAYLESRGYHIEPDKFIL
jgi:hypothetical protein